MGPSAELHFRDHAYLGLNQIGHDQTNVALVVPSERARHARGGVEQFFSDALARVSRRARNGSKPARWSAPFWRPVPSPSGRARVIAPGALLVGDAADFFDPATGDGIYCALRGAELVAETVADGIAAAGTRQR